MKFGAAVDFTHESEYAGLPMTAPSKIRLAGRAAPPSEASPAWPAIQADLRGSFGARGDRLHVAVDAPQLERLKFGVAGKLKLDADVSGTIKRPEIVGDYSAQALTSRARIALPRPAAMPKCVAGWTARCRSSRSARLQGAGEPEHARCDAQRHAGEPHLRRQGCRHAARAAPQLALSGQGRVEGAEDGWQGMIRTLEERSTVNLRLAGADAAHRGRPAVAAWRHAAAARPRAVLAHRQPELGPWPDPLAGEPGWAADRPRAGAGRNP
ncbi:hypothetical protein ACTMU2_38775 [Cupriavidus basilensis]